MAKSSLQGCQIIGKISVFQYENRVHCCLGPGSALGEKEKIDGGEKKSASEATLFRSPDFRSALFARRFVFPFFAHCGAWSQTRSTGFLGDSLMPRQLSQLMRPPPLRDLAYKAHTPVFRNHLMVLDLSNEIVQPQGCSDGICL